MSEFMSYDPWRKVTTRNGIQGEGSRVENELPVDENYKARLLALLDKIEQETPQQVEDAFIYNAWQA